MTSSDVWTEETARTYDEDARDRFDPAVLGPTVRFLRQRAAGGRALELAVGTGRVALALADAGTPVSGIELSAPMIAALRAKDAAERVPVVQGDMATATAPGRFTLAYLVFNSISNLKTQEEQVAVFENVARHLAPGGRFVVELGIPPLRRLPPGQLAAPFDVSEQHLGFDVYDLVDQRCTSHHVFRDPDGGVRMDSGDYRYAWPAELDLMARIAGMRLDERFEDFEERPFTSDSPQHVSVWRRTA